MVQQDVTCLIVIVYFGNHPRRVVVIVVVVVIFMSNQLYADANQLPRLGNQTSYILMNHVTSMSRLVFIVCVECICALVVSS